MSNTISGTHFCFRGVGLDNSGYNDQWQSFTFTLDCGLRKMQHLNKKLFNKIHKNKFNGKC